MIQEVIITAARVAKFLYDTAQKVKANNKSCEALAQNIEKIGKLLGCLKNDIDDNQHYIHTVNEFNELILKCEEFVSTLLIKDTNEYIQAIKDFVYARSYEAQFKKFNQELDNMHNRLPSYLITQQLSDRIRDKEDENRKLQQLLQFAMSNELPEEHVYNTAKMFFENHQYDQAFALFKIVAGKSYAKAYCALGNYYCRPEETGNIVAKNLENTRLALAWFDRGIKAGHWRCEYQKGVLLENGTNGIEVDKQQAYQCYQHAASQHEEHAQRRCRELGLTW